MVPPGIEKRPDQAARISQSVDFDHLSDILAFFGVPHFLTLFLLIFHFSVLSLFHFLRFSDFSLFLILLIFHFFTFLPLLCVRPYCVKEIHFSVHRGEYESCVWWFSPLLMRLVFFLFLFFICFSCRGDSQGRNIVDTLVLPSLNRTIRAMPPDFTITCRGDSQGRIEKATLVLPSLNRNSFSGVCFPPFFNSCQGDYTGDILINSRSPHCVFNHMNLGPFWGLSTICRARGCAG